MRNELYPYRQPPDSVFKLMANHPERATKVCPVCGRPFQWRKKWKDVWEEVRYCSERCRRRRSRAVDPLGAE
jgi:hypothetical protein